MAINFPSYETVKGWFVGLLPMIKRVIDLLRSPVISARLLAPVGNDYYLEVRNKGGGVAVVIVELQSVQDGQGNDLGTVTDSVRIGEKSHTLEASKLSGNDRSLFAILSIARVDQKPPRLLVVAVVRR